MPQSKFFYKMQCNHRTCDQGLIGNASACCLSHEMSTVNTHIPFLVIPEVSTSAAKHNGKVKIRVKFLRNALVLTVAGVIKCLNCTNEPTS